MNVRLIWVTPDGENLIAYIARVSNPENQDNPDYTKLIRYLIKNKHWSPFEMVDMCVEIETSLPIATQLLRHKSMSFQQFSARYSEMKNVEFVELRAKAIKNRQSSEEIIDPIIQFGEHDIPASELVEESITTAFWTYNRLLEAGVAKECARMVLPVCTQTRLYVKGNIRSWIHYIQLRTEEHTQKEHRLIAEEIKKLFILYFPTISEALCWTGEEII